MMSRNSARKVILDTDIGWMNDDCTAAMFALKSPDLEVMGITPIMGNFDLQWEVTCALRLLEVLGHDDVPVCPGFDRPLVHERSAYADQVWGGWATFKAFETIPPGMPKLQPDRRHASDFIAESILNHPGEVTILAVGPLTNLAVAVRKFPQIVEQVKEVVIMGGNIPVLPEGHGNITPFAEFNFWVDPEAARIVLRSGMPITLFPLNICRQTQFDRKYFDRLAGSESKYPQIASLFRDYLQSRFEDAELEKKSSLLYYGLYDHCVIGYAIKPELFAVTEMQVDVSLAPGTTYGACYGYKKGPYTSGVADSFPLNDGSKVIKVAYGVDFEALAELYVGTLT
jgi:inosine-uridine nucleoside N-ribohydrolase